MRENNERQMEDYKHGLVRKLEGKEESLQRVQREKEHQMLFRHNDEVIRRTDKKENVERIMKVQEYEREKLMGRIEEKMSKADHIKNERAQLLDQRQLMKKEIEKQKRDMMDKIDKLKQGKIDPN